MYNTRTYYFSINMANINRPPFRINCFIVHHSESIASSSPTLLIYSVSEYNPTIYLKSTIDYNTKIHNNPPQFKYMIYATCITIELVWQTNRFGQLHHPHVQGIVRANELHILQQQDMDAHPALSCYAIFALFFQIVSTTMYTSI